MPGFGFMVDSTDIALDSIATPESERSTLTAASSRQAAPRRARKNLSWRLWTLGWLGFLAVPLVHLDATMIGATALSILLFVPVYTATEQSTGVKLWLSRVWTFCIGMALFPFNPFAHTYFLYAGFPGNRASVRESICLILFGLLASFGYFAYRHLDSMYYLLMSVLLLSGGGAMLLSQVQRRAADIVALKDKEIVQLARIAERERIARDLHDVLGHTLSLVALKADLALRLQETDRARSAAEMSDVGRIARRALADVRQTIGGMHRVTWDEGLQTALALLDAANVVVQVDAPDTGSLDPISQTAFAHVLIEASTNISRHANATKARFILAQEKRAATLTVQDNGAAGPWKEGNGLHGLRVRLEAAGGSLELVNVTSGLQLIARLPTSEQLLT